MHICFCSPYLNCIELYLLLLLLILVLLLLLQLALQVVAGLVSEKGQIILNLAIKL